MCTLDRGAAENNPTEGVQELVGVDHSGLRCESLSSQTLSNPLQCKDTEIDT